MKVTKMRIKGEIPSTDSVLAIANELTRRFAKAGFITAVSFGETRSSLKIGLHMHTFHLDTAKHDRNLRHNPHMGPKLTTTPTWDQRVEFNNIVNAVLNKFRVSANIKSGDFVVRAGRTTMTERDWQSQVPEYMRHNENRGYYIEECNEAEYLEERRIQRNKLARERRLLKQNRQWDVAKVRLSIVETKAVQGE